MDDTEKKIPRKIKINHDQKAKKYALLHIQIRNDFKNRRKISVFYGDKVRYFHIFIQ